MSGRDFAHVQYDVNPYILHWFEALFRLIRSIDDTYRITGYFCDSKTRKLKRKLSSSQYLSLTFLVCGSVLRYDADSINPFVPSDFFYLSCLDWSNSN